MFTLSRNMFGSVSNNYICTIQCDTHTVPVLRKSTAVTPDHESEKVENQCPILQEILLPCESNPLAPVLPPLLEPSEEQLFRFADARLCMCSTRFLPRRLLASSAVDLGRGL